MRQFFRVTLRTTDVDAARVFYAAVLGDGALHVVRLHEQAIARGARPHWLGFIDVGDVDHATAAFVQRGATLLGPKWVDLEGLEVATMRDPGGAVVALAKPPADAPAPKTPATGSASVHVLSYLLHTTEVERAKANYGELLGWAFETPIDLGSLGVLHPFAWERGGPPVGAMSDIASRPHVHSHWLFQFGVPALATATEAVRAAGGVVVEAVTLPSGEQIAICDDPQGASFAMRQPAAAGARSRPRA